MDSVRTILHVDLDAFYASVEERENPVLRGRPVIVGADPKGGRGRGVVSTASYAARRFGVHSAQPISEAFRLCPQGVFLEPRMDLYSEVAHQVFAIYGRYTDAIEPLSIDEAFLDVSGSLELFGGGLSIARRIQTDVETEQKLFVSIGIAPNKFLAKIGSDLNKPRGLVEVDPDRVPQFLENLPVERLFGAGRKTAARMRDLGLFTIGQVARLPREKLVEMFSEHLGNHFHELSRGVDPRPVVKGRERKSLGKEVTFERDEADRHKVERTLFQLVDEMCFDLRAEHLKGRCVTVKLRTSDFETSSRSRTVAEAMDTAEEIWPVARQLLAKADCTRLQIRLVGVSVSEFSGQRGLFEGARESAGRRIARAVDSVTARFGKEALRRAALLQGSSRPLVPKDPDPPRAGE